MSFSLVWIEVLLAGLLWVVAGLAIVARIQRKWRRRLAMCLVLAAPLLLLSALAALTAYLKFSLGYGAFWLQYTGGLLLVFCIITIAIAVRAWRPSPLHARNAIVWPRGRLAGAWITVVALLFMTLWNIDLETRSRAAMLKVQAGTLLLESSPPPIPDSQNAALIYQRVFPRLRGDVTAVADPALPKSAWEIVDSDAPDFTNPIALAVVERHQRTIELIRQAVALPDCRFDYDYAAGDVSAFLADATHMRDAARLLRFHVRYELSRGNVEGAILDVNAIFRIARDVGREPWLIGEMINIGLDSYAVRLLEEVLPHVTAKQQLTGLDPGDSEMLGRGLRRCLGGEEALGLTFFSEMAEGNLRSQTIKAITHSDNSQNSLSGWSAGLFRIFLLGDELDAYMDVLSGYRQAAAQPYYRAQPQVDAINASLRQRGNAILVSILTPSLTRAFGTVARGQASHSLAIVAMALTRYRADHGDYPPQLSSLVPAYLDEIPPDPYDGKPLRYRSSMPQRMIYSIGPDGKDDGGAPFDFRASTGDISFALRDRQTTPASRP